jgi:predicted dehydrogenase
VLVDKPWIINAADFPKLEATFKAAEAKKLIAYDIMTERSEITTILQKELIHAPEVFGEMQKGSESDPAVYIESIHHILKVVAGAPNIRPAWFFDVKQQGEGVADVGTHLADLVQWMLFPEQVIDYKKEVNVLSG